MLAFWVAAFGVNALLLPCRTLVADVLPPEDIVKGNAVFAVWDGKR